VEMVAALAKIPERDSDVLQHQRVQPRSKKEHRDPAPASVAETVQEQHDGPCNRDELEWQPQTGRIGGIPGDTRGGPGEQSNRRRSCGQCHDLRRARPLAGLSPNAAAIALLSWAA